MKTMILFLSAYDKTRNPEPAEYTTDRDFTVYGTQTNEAPVKYAIERLKRNDEHIGKIVALTTPKAEKTAFEHFATEIEKCSPITDIIKVNIPNDVSTTELLQKTLEELLPTLSPPDTVIIETTGGYRNAVNALTLLARFLRYRGIAVDFSTYSDWQQKYISDTKETDNLLDMLDAVNIFATSGNPIPLIDSIKYIKSKKEKTAFVKAIRDFYDMVICCKIDNLNDVVKNLQDALEGIKNMEYKVDKPKLLIFRELVQQIVREKMYFIYEENYLYALICWCCENGYLQQAVVILVEKVLSYMEYNKSKEKYFRKKAPIANYIDHQIYLRLVKYRDEFSHAMGADIKATADNIKDDIIRTVDKLKSCENELYP